MTEQLELLGPWRINWDVFKKHCDVRNRPLPGSLAQLVATQVPELLGGGRVDDFSATYDERRQPRNPYLRFIPTGTGTADDEVNGLVTDADLFVYSFGKVEDGPLGMLKQRGWHGEICYKKNGIAWQTAAWDKENPEDRVRDRPIAHLERQNVMGHVFRYEVPTMKPASLALLRAQVRLWKTVYQLPKVPSRENWNSDQSDFNSVESLGVVAKTLLQRAPNEEPALDPVTCIQWVYTVLCLALLYPLTEEVLEELSCTAEYQRNWLPSLGRPPATLPRLHELPFPPYSPGQILQAYLDVYNEGEALVELLARLPEGGVGDLIASVASLFPRQEVRDEIPSYFEQVIQTKDVGRQLKHAPHGFVIPSSFFWQSRAPDPDPARPWFRYVATVVHQDFLKLSG